MLDGKIVQTAKPWVGVTQFEGPNAFPAPAMASNADGINFYAGGGLTKLEWMAGTIAAGLFTGSVEDVSGFVSSVVDLSQKLLDECAKRQTTKA